MLWVFQPTSVTRVLFDGVLATCFGMVRGGNTKGTLLCRTGVGGGVRWRCGRRQKLNYSTERCHVWTSGIGTEMKWISTVLISLFCEGWYSCHTQHSVPLPTDNWQPQCVTHTTFRPAPHRQLTAPVQSTPPAIYHFPAFTPKSLQSLVRCPKVLNLNGSPTDRLFTYWPTFHLLTDIHLLTDFSPTDRHSSTDRLFTYWPTFTSLSTNWLITVTQDESGFYFKFALHPEHPAEGT